MYSVNVLLSTCKIFSLLLYIKDANKRVIHDVYWRDYIDGYIPPDAFPSQEGLYIGQMPLNGILPGTIYPNKKVIVSECCTGRKEATAGIKVNPINI